MRKELQLGCGNIIENEVVLEHLDDEGGLLYCFSGRFEDNVLSDSTLCFFDLFPILHFYDNVRRTQTVVILFSVLILI